MITFKKFLGPMVLVGLLFFSACAKYTDPNVLSPVDFNNKFVEVINPLKERVEEVQKLYVEAIPKELTKDTTIDVTTMEARYEELDAITEKARDLQKSQSRNAAQETAVLAEYQTYLQDLDAYLDQYDAMILFYKSGEFKLDSAEVKEYDNKLNEGYKKFAEQHNKLVDVLGGFKE